MRSWNTLEKERGRERTKGKFDRSVLREVDSRRNGRTTRRVLDGNKARNFVRLEPCAPLLSTAVPHFRLYYLEIGCSTARPTRDPVPRRERASREPACF